MRGGHLFQAPSPASARVARSTVGNRAGVSRVRRCWPHSLGFRVQWGAGSRPRAGGLSLPVEDRVDGGTEPRPSGAERLPPSARLCSQACREDGSGQDGGADAWTHSSPGLASVGSV